MVCCTCPILTSSRDVTIHRLLRPSKPAIVPVPVPVPVPKSEPLVSHRASETITQESHAIDVPALAEIPAPVLQPVVPAPTEAPAPAPPVSTEVSSLGVPSTIAQVCYVSLHLVLVHLRT